MAVDTPVLERPTEEERTYSVPSRMQVLAEEEHNARIRDTYRKLINPNSKIEDVFARAEKRENVDAAGQTAFETPVEQRLYTVESARVSSDIFRADSAINARVAEPEAEEVYGETADYAEVEETVAEVAGEEDEELRPSAATMQYRTVDQKQEKKTLFSSLTKKDFVFGKKEKIIVAVFVAVVVALIALVIINSTIISNLNAEIAQVQEGITTVRGAIAGVNSTFDEIINSSISH